MSLKVEKLEGNMAKLTIECSAEEFEAALQQAYLKARTKISLPGFRKGKAPRNMIEKMYGAGVFYEDAANELIPRAYDEAMETEEGKALDVVSQPDIDVVQIEKGKSFIFTADVALKPEVELGEYKNFADVEKKSVEVTDEDLEKELDKVREQNARTITVDDRALEMGDTAIIDYEGFCDGEAFEGGKAENSELKLGSHTFIDTFEDQLVGKNIGDEVEVNVTFPAEYQAPNLAGKAATFKVKVNGIKVKELPELDDEFAEEISDFDTLDEYKEDLKKKLAEQKQAAADTEYQNAVLAKAVENAKMDIPDAMVTYQARQQVNQFAQQMQMQGLNMDTYFQITGQNADSLVESMKDQALVRIKNSLVLEAIADAEKVEVTEEEVDAEVKKMAEQYGMEEAQVRQYLSDAEIDSMKTDLRMQKTLELIAK